MPDPAIGLISDTHGLLRPQALQALEGCEHIVHAGDIVDPAILDALARLAPVVAVRGNNDRGAWADALPESTVLEWRGRRVQVVHEMAHLRRHPQPAPPDVVVTGHSHRPLVETRGGTLFVNPGSAGPRRFSLPVTVARLVLAAQGLRADIVTLLPSAGGRET